MGQAMSTIAWNQYKDFVYIEKYDASAASFTEIDPTTTAFDYFTDDMTAGDYLALIATGNNRDTRRRNIKINVGTAVAATDVVIKLQYDSSGGSSAVWTEIMDVTDYFTSTGEKTIEFDVPYPWPMTYSHAMNGRQGWVMRFLIESVDTPTEGGAQTTTTIQGGDNCFTVTAIGGANPVNDIYNYCVAAGLNLVTKNGSTYLVKNCWILVGGDDSSAVLSGTNVVFDGCDSYVMLFKSVVVTWVGGVYSINIGDYRYTSAAYRYGIILTGVVGTFTNFALLQSGDGYSALQFGGTVTMNNCLIYVKNANMTFSGGILNGVTTAKGINLGPNFAVAYKVKCGRIQPFYSGGVYTYESDITDDTLSTYSTYYTCAHVDCLSSGGRIKSGAGIATSWMPHQVLNTYQAFIRDNSGNPVDGALVKINTTSFEMPEFVTSTRAMTTSSRLEVDRGGKTDLVCRDAVFQVESELMKVVHPAEDCGKCGVTRGVLGTTAATHAIGTTATLMGLGYFYTGYVDENLSQTDFMANTSFIDTTASTTFANQPLRWTKLVLCITDFTTAGTLNIVGTDIMGNAIDEDIQINANGYYTTVARFASLVSVTSATFVGDCKIGLYGSFYPQHILDNAYTYNGTASLRYWYEDYTVEVTKDGYQPLTLTNVKFKQKTLLELELLPESSRGISSGYIS